MPERVAGTRERASVAPPDCLRELKPGDAILMDDGMIQLEVEDAADDAVHCRVVAGGRISDHKGISFAHVPLPLQSMPLALFVDVMHVLEPHEVPLA